MLELTRHLVGGTALAGGDHDEELHDSVIHLGAAGLHNEDILFSDARHDPHARLALFQPVS